MTNLPGFLQTPFMAGLSTGFFLVILAWSLFWKGWALWRSARTGHKWWFVALLVINTVGILEILYLFVFSKKGGVSIMKTEESKTPEPPMSTM